VSRTFRFKVKKNQVGSSGRDAEVKVYIDGDTAHCDIFKDLAVIGWQLGVFTKEDGSPIKGACNWFFVVTIRCTKWVRARSRWSACSTKTGSSPKRWRVFAEP
jgi:hypothetical protein